MTGIITLGLIRAAGPCVDGWRKLLASLGFTGASYPVNYTLSIGDVAVSNGAADAMWCLRFIDDPRTRVRAVMPAVKRAAVHTTDRRVHDCIAAVERWLDGDNTVDLRAAARAADDAAGSMRRKKGKRNV